MMHAAYGNTGPMIPLVKIDEEQRLVIGRAAQEVPDRAKEILDYASAVPAFKTWSDDVFRDSRGLSKGNLRVMHQKDVVAGKVTDITFNDAEKAVDIVAKVVDDNEWRKVLAGCYTGFSMGGGYAKRWDDNGVTRYTPIITEISLVDRPCIPSAIIADLVKRDGGIERITLRGQAHTFGEMWRPEPRSFGELWKADNYDESEHPRGPDGRWVATNYGVGAAMGAIPGAIGGYLKNRGAGALVGAGLGVLGGAVSTGLVNVASKLQAGRGEDWRDYTVGTAAATGSLPGAMAGGLLGAVAGAVQSGAARWLQNRITDLLASAPPEKAAEYDRLRSLTDKDLELIIVASDPAERPAEYKNRDLSLTDRDIEMIIQALNKPLDYKAAK